KPHPRSYGTFPRKIARFARDNRWLSIEQAVRAGTGLPADILQLKDRGYLKAGQLADIAVFDLEKLEDHATFTDPHQYCTGFKRVYVAGRAAIIDDEYTGVLAGRPLRYKGVNPD
ncbi:MAG: amidohydrolase family protein, partial [Planctomycetota bacterium]